MFPSHSLVRRLPALVLLGCLLALFAPARLVRAQTPPTPVWIAARYGSGLMALDAQGSVYTAGASYSLSTYYDYFTAKTDAGGKLLWSASYNGPVNEYDAANAIAVDTQGNVYVTGRSDTVDNYPVYTSVYATIKYDSNGKQLWAANYNASGMGDVGTAIAVDAQGNVYVTGYSGADNDHHTYTHTDYATVKYDTNGKQLWAARYNGPGNAQDTAVSLALDTQNNVYITGTSTNADGSTGYATIKYDNNGNQSWVARSVGTGATSYAQKLVVDAQGSVYVTGASTSGSGPLDYVTLKYDTNGNQLWIARFHSLMGSSRPADMALDAQGYVYVTGYADNLAAIYFPSNYATVKYDTNGNQLWAARYNGTGGGPDSASALAVDAQGSVYVTGTSYLGGSIYSNPSDCVTLKYDTNGTQLWTARYHDSSLGSTYGRAIALDAQGNLYVGGSVILKYSAATLGAVTMQNITSQTTIMRSGLRYMRATGHWTQTITVRNAVTTFNGSVAMAAFNGPLTLALDNLGAGVTLVNRTGGTANQLPLNSPYITAALSGVGNGDSRFDPGESVTFTLEFADSSGAPLTYTPRVLVGPGTP